MEGLVSLLLFAGIFYLMMRFGCGAHLVHGGHGEHGGRDGTDAKHVDPVCGMKVDPQQGYGKMHQGELYRFCSRSCVDEFEAEPDKFVHKVESEKGG